MLKKTVLAVVAVLVGMGGFGWMPSARAADDEQSSSTRARVEKKRGEAKAERERKKADRKVRRESRKADRSTRREDRRGFLERLWPFGKDKEPQGPLRHGQFGSVNFGSGNPRDTSTRRADEPFFKQKIRSIHPPRREGMEYVRPDAHKKHRKSASTRAKAVPSHNDREHAREIHSHKNGEFRRDVKRTHRRPTGLNWHAPQNAKKKKGPETHSHKDGYRRDR